MTAKLTTLYILVLQFDILNLLSFPRLRNISPCSILFVDSFPPSKKYWLVITDTPHISVSCICETHTHSLREGCDMPIFFAYIFLSPTSWICWGEGGQNAILSVGAGSKLSWMLEYCLVHKLFSLFTECIMYAFCSWFYTTSFVIRVVILTLICMLSVFNLSPKSTS